VSAAQPQRFRVEIRTEPDRVVVQLFGELDLVGAPLLASELERTETDRPPLLVLDVSELEFVDSAGLRVILAANARARERGAELVLTPTPPQLQRLLSIAGVEEHLRVATSAEAIRPQPSQESSPPR